MPSISRAKADQAESGRFAAAGEGEEAFAAPAAVASVPVLFGFDEQALSRAAVVAASPPVRMALRCGIPALPMRSVPFPSCAEFAPHRIGSLPGRGVDATLARDRLGAVQR
ncbi:hypothetical protein SSP24_62930 [Streptomyces spinoverrucosus]|uniref:Uncharacterized protein n=1 Tax=Streptomyces spinoverrucosus TaxID=284043 RepID=A0A4Y3VR11_9ACTN|nr:hypothetical protein SSP24_62930 [Streptomyces spinoverrucosus]GHB68663.1 hypothetical protein GCM10010397_43680 [Streptomyces spinoverrucosus]